MNETKQFGDRLTSLRLFFYVTYFRCLKAFSRKEATCDRTKTKRRTEPGRKSYLAAHNQEEIRTQGSTSSRSPPHRDYNPPMTENI